MKTQIRTSAMVGAAGAAKQAATESNKTESPAPESARWRVLDVDFFAEDGLNLAWFSDEKGNETLWRHLDGRLFLSLTQRGDDSDELVREVSFDEARDWLVKTENAENPEKFLALHGNTRPTPEPAAPETSAVNDMPPSSAKELPPLKRRPVIRMSAPSMEDAMHYATGLLELFSRMDGAVRERTGNDANGSVGCGIINWGQDLASRLHDDFLAADVARREGGDRITTIRKLRDTIAKVRALLLMLAHDLSSGGQFIAYERSKMRLDLPEEDLSPFLSLAADCIEYLEVSFYDDFGRHLPMPSFDREYEEVLLQKFVGSQQERAAA